ncbi:TNF receptor-associated factor 6-like [Ornithodoros turicata]|uniref:TNF receptor-associated factor 6-like n=1 Tax=Ornithodoros turicata TaxID=34597 RepID=UPI00313A000F
MEVKLKDFENLPEGFAVKFPHPLEAGLFCDLCKNIVPTLWLDPEGHWFCEDCVNMATTDGIFECPSDERAFSSSQLRKDSTVVAKLKNQLVICPNSSVDVPVKIRFSALKAHLSGCSCKMTKCPLCGVSFDTRSITEHIVSECSEGSTSCPSCGEDVLRKDLVNHQLTRHSVDTSPKVPVPSFDNPAKPSTPSPVSLPERSPAQFGSASRQTAAAPTQLKEEPKCKCPYCKNYFPKRSIQGHISRRECSNETTRGDALHSVIPQAPVTTVESASPARAAIPETEPFDGRNFRTSPGIPNQNHPEKEMRLAKAEMAVEDIKRQQGTLKQELHHMFAEHTQNLKNDKDEITKNITNLILEFTEEQQRIQRQSGEQMRMLQEKNDLLQTTVEALSNDLDLLREEVKALRIMQSNMQHGLKK